jgi:hypothetical protein
MTPISMTPSGDDAHATDLLLKFSSEKALEERRTRDRPRSMVQEPGEGWGDDERSSGLVGFVRPRRLRGLREEDLESSMGLDILRRRWRGREKDE